jgi:hypothetical protein
MRTTIDLSPTLMRAAKARAAEQGEPLKDLVSRAVAREVGLPARTTSCGSRPKKPLVGRLPARLGHVMERNVMLVG